MIDMNRKVLSRISGDLLLNEPYLPRMSQCGANILETVTAITVLGVVGCHGFIQLSRDEVMVCQWSALTHWGRVTHICVNKLTIIGSDNDLSPGRRQAIIWTNAGILLIGPLETNFSDISIEIHIFWFKKMHLNMSSGNWQPFCLGVSVLTSWLLVMWDGGCKQEMMLASIYDMDK